MTTKSKYSAIKFFTTDDPTIKSCVELYRTNDKLDKYLITLELNHKDKYELNAYRYDYLEDDYIPFSVVSFTGNLLTLGFFKDYHTFDEIMISLKLTTEDHEWVSQLIDNLHC
jgi:hypothetical protein